MKLMVPQKRMLTSALELDAIRTDRFKTETLSVTVTVPVDKHLTPLYVFALSILKRGTVQYPSQGALNRRLDDLYATGISLKVDRFGSNCLLGFGADMLEKAYEIAVESTPNPNLNYLHSILLCWHEEGIRTPQDADRDREARKSAPEGNRPKTAPKQAPSPKATSFDVDDFFAAAIGKGYGEKK